MIETSNPDTFKSSPGFLVSPDAEAIYRLFHLSPSVPPSLKDLSPTSLQFLEGLIGAKCYIDAVEFLAHGLPDLLGIEWAHTCLVNHGLASHGKNNTKEENLLQTIQDWLAERNDNIRRLIGAQGEEIGFDHPLGWLAMAVFWSEGSITPEGTSETLPPPGVKSHMVSGAINLLAVQEPKNIEENYEVFLNIGMKAALKGTLKEGE